MRNVWIAGLVLGTLAGCGTAIRVRTNPPRALVLLERADLTTNPQVTRNFAGPGEPVLEKILGMTPLCTSIQEEGPGLHLRIEAPGFEDLVVPFGEEGVSLDVELTPAR